jgi:polyribonucleotide nucleotidyltransferase
MAIKQSTIDLDGKSIILETGLLAVQANGAVTVRCGDTLVLAAVVSGPKEEGIDYFPLHVEYRERYYAGGVISSSRFIKREGKPSDTEVLTSRLIDRSIRPLFPKNYYDQVQVVVTPLSYDGENDPAILGIIAASAALTISDIPWNGPVGAVRLGLLDEKVIINPVNSDRKNSSLDLVLSGSKGSIAMVEAGAKEVTENQILSALETGQKQIDEIIAGIKTFGESISKVKKNIEAEQIDSDLEKFVNDNLDYEAILGDSQVVGEGLKLAPIIDKLIEKNPEANRNQINKIIDESLKQLIRDKVLKEKTRFDGRKPDEIRPINVQVGLLPRTHGSALFQRGLTHALSIVTLGSPAREQLIESMSGEETKRYMHHYNMPGYANGEPGRLGAPNRREIGHGALAERALLPVIPEENEFPYTIRVVSEIVSSNGSTSQASVCGSTLALMDAGVPIKKPIAGIAMGLISEKENYITLSDIAGIEDHFGDMDFKVAGSTDGITALQMDVKIPGVSAKMLGEALDQAKAGRLFILNKMTAVINTPKTTISQFAPKIVTLTIDPEKIGEIIGPGGRIIRKLQSDFSVQIDIDDTGSLSITGTVAEQVDSAKKAVEGLVAEIEIGQTYKGTVTRVESFGAFVEVLPGKNGLVHVSRMGKGFVNDANEVLSVGDQVTVKADEVDDKGRLNISLVEGGRTPTNSKPREVQKDRPQGSPPFKRFRDHR